MLKNHLIKFKNLQIRRLLMKLKKSNNKKYQPEIPQGELVQEIVQSKSPLSK